MILVITRIGVIFQVRIKCVLLLMLQDIEWLFETIVSTAGFAVTGLKEKPELEDVFRFLIQAIPGVIGELGSALNVCKGRRVISDHHNMTIQLMFKVVMQSFFCHQA